MRKQHWRQQKSLLLPVLLVLLPTSLGLYCPVRALWKAVAAGTTTHSDAPFNFVDGIESPPLKF